MANILREIRNVLVEGAVLDGEETDLVVLQRHELSEMRRADSIQIFRRSTRPGAQK